MVHPQGLQEGRLLTSILPVIWVFLGGALGSTSRNLLGEMISNGAFIVLLVNVLGTAIAGAIGFREKSTRFQQLFWLTGFTGGFTTFSSLSFFLVKLPLVESAMLAGLTLVLSLSLLAAMGKR